MVWCWVSTDPVELYCVMEKGLAKSANYQKNTTQTIIVINCFKPLVVSFRILTVKVRWLQLWIVHHSWTFWIGNSQVQCRKHSDAQSICHASVSGNGCSNASPSNPPNLHLHTYKVVGWKLLGIEGYELWCFWHGPYCDLMEIAFESMTSNGSLP